MQREELLREIDGNRDLIEERCRLTPEQAETLDRHYRLTNTFTSNAVEGNRFSLQDVKLVLEDGISVGGKTLRDLFETIFHAKAFDTILKTARENSTDFVSESLLDIISGLHRTFYEFIDRKYAGVYRDVRVMITGARTVLPPPDMLETFMDGFRDSFARHADAMHPVRLAAFAHLRFVQIHPYVDGNGRIARLLTNFVLVNRGYQIINVGEDSLSQYYDTLDRAETQDDDDNEFLDLFTRLELNAQKEFMRLNNMECPGPVPPTRSS
ncbi:MAG: Fic family protein [Deltaproteobacteria bacterium]|nr:Fic family protein [Deltaproteobacteria bacterium]